MVNKRLELHEILCKIVGITEPDGDRHVYYNPPESVNMKYPAIRYSRSNIKNKYADNGVYGQKRVYELIVIDRDPDSHIVNSISILPECVYARGYKASNLNHDVFYINY
jgi:hypothetical protein